MWAVALTGKSCESSAMSRRRVAVLTNPLPFRLREMLQGYAGTVFTAAPTIFADTDIQMTVRRRNDLMFAATVRRLWQLVDGQATILDGSLAQLGEHGVAAFRVGATSFSRTSEAYRDLHSLRDRLFRWLSDHDATYLLTDGPLNELALEIAARDGDDEP